MCHWFTLIAIVLVCQSSNPAEAGQAPGSADVSRAQRALEAGRADEALQIAEGVLKVHPGHDGAAAAKVDALVSLDRFTAALDAYDAWYKFSQRENLPLARRLARSTLESLGQADQSSIRIDATAALAGSGQADARKKLETAASASPPTPESWPAIVAVAGLGDAKAQGRLLQAAKESSGSGKVEAIAALASGGMRGAEPVLRDALSTHDANLQAAAADAAVVLGLKTLVPELERVAKEGDQFGKLAAAVAVAKLGGKGGEALVDAGLTSPAPDARLLSASALKARGRSGWVDVVRPLLQSPDGLVRYQAAELLLSVDRKAAMQVLMAGTVDPNLNVRAEVARILAADPDVELAQFRRLLRDGAPRVRLEAARTLLSRTSADKGPRK